jgi:hypothetical protein
MQYCFYNNHVYDSNSFIFTKDVKKTKQQHAKTNSINIG